MTSLSLPAKALVDPVDGVAAAVEGRRWALPMVALALCASLAGAAGALRWDPTSTVVSEMAEKGELARASEREVQDGIQQAGRIRLVAGISGGVTTPLTLLFIAVALKLAAWLLGAKAPFGKCFTAAAVAMLPIALYHLLFAVVAFHQLGVTLAQAKTLVPSSLLALSPDAAPKLARFLGAVDFFSLWSAALLGLGFAQAAEMKKGRALVVGFVLYAMYAAVFLVALPGLSGGPR